MLSPDEAFAAQVFTGRLVIRNLRSLFRNKTKISLTCQDITNGLNETNTYRVFELSSIYHVAKIYICFASP